jgi:hypothetical protein
MLRGAPDDGESKRDNSGSASVVESSSCCVLPASRACAHIRRAQSPFCPNRHGLGMNGGHADVGIRGQKSENVHRDLSLLDRPNRCSACLNSGEDGKRPLLIECEPDRLTGRVRPQLVLAYAREGHQASTFWVQPSPPIGRPALSSTFRIFGGFLATSPSRRYPRKQ